MCFRTFLFFWIFRKKEYKDIEKKIVWDILHSFDYHFSPGSMNKTMRVIKANESHQTAIFVVLEPESIDRNGDIVSLDTITKAAHEFMINLSEKVVNLDHTKGDVTDMDKEEAAFVESYILPAKIDGEDEDGNKYTIPAGSWMVGIKFSDELWKGLLAGDFTGISLEGWGQYF